MSAVWMTGEFLRFYSTASLPLELDQQEGLPFVSKMFVNEIWRQAISTLQVGKLQLQIEVTGGLLSRQALRRVRRGERSSGMRGESADGWGQHQYPQSLARNSSATTATKPADLESDCTATEGAATQPLIETWRWFHCLLGQTDANNILLYISYYSWSCENSSMISSLLKCCWVSYISQNRVLVVRYAAVLSVVMQRGKERCVTTLKTSVLVAKG